MSVELDESDSEPRSRDEEEGLFGVDDRGLMRFVNDLLCQNFVIIYKEFICKCLLRFIVNLFKIYCGLLKICK